MINFPREFFMILSKHNFYISVKRKLNLSISIINTMSIANVFMLNYDNLPHIHNDWRNKLEYIVLFIEVFDKNIGVVSYMPTAS